MGPKKKGGGKKGKGKKAPKADPGWAKTIQSGKWDRPFESLPNAVLWPTYAPIREAFLQAVQDLEMIWSQTLAESFLEEFFKIPRPNLLKMNIRGAYTLKKFVLSPYDVLPAITYLDISCMAVLEFVLIQCTSLEWLTLARSPSLKKALIETRNLKELIIDTCPKLSTLMVWSEQLTAVKGVSDSKELQKLILYCPLLADFEHPKLYVPVKPKVFHPTILQLRKWEDKQQPLPDKEFGLLAKNLVHGSDDGLHEDVGYPNVPRFPRTLLQGY